MYSAKNSDVDISTKPSYLNAEEIEELVQEIDNVIAPTQELAILARDNLRSFLRQELPMIQITMQGYEQLAERIQQRFQIAQVEAGKPVGLAITELLMAGVMQTTLSAFHRAGTKVNTGYSDIKQVLYIYNPTISEVYLHFNEPMTADRIFELRKELVVKKVADLVTKTRIEILDEQPDWLLLHFDLLDKPNDYGKDLVWFILELNMADLITYGVTVIKLIEHLSQGIVEVYASPVKESCLYICMTPETAVNFPTELEQRIFFNRKYWMDRNRKEITGKYKIMSLLPAKIDMMNSVEIEVNLLDYEIKALEEKLDLEFYEDHEYRQLKVSPAALMFQGVEMHQLIKLLEYEEETAESLEKKPAFDVVPLDDFNLIVGVPKSLNIAKTTLGNYIISRSQVNNADPKLIELLYHHYAILESDQLRSIMKLPYCNQKTTISNRFDTMTMVHGAEVTAAYHEYRTNKAMREIGSTGNPRFLHTFTRIIFFRGYPIGIAFDGLAKANDGFYTQATIEQSGTVLTTHGLYDEDGEDARTLATSITVGVLPKLGTGLVSFGTHYNTQIKGLNKITAKDIEKLNDDREQVTNKIMQFENDDEEEEVETTNTMVDPSLVDIPINSRSTNIIRATPRIGAVNPFVDQTPLVVEAAIEYEQLPEDHYAFYEELPSKKYTAQPVEPISIAKALRFWQEE